jgi:chemotaxis signal transduction protein
MESTAVTSDGGSAAASVARWVVLECHGRFLGVPLDRVREITSPRPFTRLPGCGPEVCGLVGLRGRVITACDLGVVLRLRPAASHPDHRLIFLDGGERALAVAVEAVLMMASAEPDEAAPEPSELRRLGLGAADVLGAATLGEMRVLLLDPDALIERLLAA